MTLPVTGLALLPLGVLFGFIFGWLLQRARLTDTNVIITQLRLRDYTLFKVMLTATLSAALACFFFILAALPPTISSQQTCWRWGLAPYSSVSA